MSCQFIAAIVAANLCHRRLGAGFSAARLRGARAARHSFRCRADALDERRTHVGSEARARHVALGAAARRLDDDAMAVARVRDARARLELHGGRPSASAGAADCVRVEGGRHRRQRRLR